MNRENIPVRPLKLLMREEVAANGAPLPLASLLNATQLTIQSQPVKKLWADTMHTMKDILGAHLPLVEVVMPKLWLGDAAKAEKLNHIKAAAVSLDSYDTTGAFPLRVSRHFAKGGIRQIGIGARPGAPSLDKQLTLLTRFAAGAPIVLMEDDMYTGGTARYIIELLQARDFCVLRFIPGLQVSGIKTISGVPVEAVARYDQAEVLDVVDPRDLLFGLTDAGLVINENKLLYRAPYVLPWVDLTARASIPPGQAKDLSCAITELNGWFYTRIEQLTGQQISIKDMAPAFQVFIAQSTSYPLTGTMTGFCDYSKNCLASYN